MADEVNEVTTVVCYIHGVPETHTPGVDFSFCPECWHVWPTEQDLIADYVEATGTDKPPASAELIYACPLCAHDF